MEFTDFSKAYETAKTAAKTKKQDFVLVIYKDKPKVWQLMPSGEENMAKLLPRTMPMLFKDR